MIATERFTAALTCTDEDCEFYLIPVDVEMVREPGTGAKYVRHLADECCECGELREDYEDARKAAATFDLHIVEWVPDQVRRRTLEAA